jgi:hypothetical protein
MSQGCEDKINPQDFHFDNSGLMPACSVLQPNLLYSFNQTKEHSQ